MRLGIYCVIGLLFSANFALSQTKKSATPTPTPALPEFRPALVGSGSNALINTIDTADLIKKGQKDAAVMFTGLVAPPGDVARAGECRGTKRSQSLEKEVFKLMA